MMRPLVSIVTPTWRRHELLVETVSHLRLQDYPNIEHIVVSDGPDWERQRLLYETENVQPSQPPLRTVRFTALGHNYSGLWPESFGVAPLTVGMLLARGEYQLWWSDDDRALTPSHVSQLVGLIESTGADFVYPKVRIWRNGNPDGPETGVIGSDPPRHGQITHFMYRASLLRLCLPRLGCHPVDIDLVEQWMARGATWRMLDAVTYEHRLDQR